MTKNKKRSKPVVMWVIKHPDGQYLRWTFYSDRDTSIFMRGGPAGFIPSQDPWVKYYRKGYRCVRVKVQEV